MRSFVCLFSYWLWRICVVYSFLFSSFASFVFIVVVGVVVVGFVMICCIIMIHINLVFIISFHLWAKAVGKKQKSKMPSRRQASKAGRQAANTACLTKWRFLLKDINHQKDRRFAEFFFLSFVFALMEF